MSDHEQLHNRYAAKASATQMDRRPLVDRSRLVDRGLVDFRRVCEQMGILDRQTDTIRPVGPSLHEASK
jgi:hypothetical protein